MSTRLPGAKYGRVFDRGRSVKGRLLVAWSLSAADADREAGVVVSKKSFRHAVDRNRARRRIREVYRIHEDRFKRGFDVVIVARQRAIDGDFSEFERSFLRQCGRLRLLKEQTE